ncbi:hypothetical protein EYC84_008455 [Monilinia fructicola]|uniref:Uncharacterized protein n=1 Tax=Monilinia fructicola TaxID=38448 RepID=A0A5M9JLW5_MONFR|nr:hypothetical protein EYC84_008455 [Monilinia fructicola]
MITHSFTKHAPSHPEDLKEKDLIFREKLLPSRSQMNISPVDPKKINHLHSRSMHMPQHTSVHKRPPFIWKCPAKYDRRCPRSYPFSCKSPELHAMLIHSLHKPIVIVSFRLR